MSADFRRCLAVSLIQSLRCAARGMMLYLAVPLACAPLGFSQSTPATPTVTIIGTSPFGTIYSPVQVGSGAIYGVNQGTYPKCAGNAGYCGGIYQIIININSTLPGYPVVGEVSQATPFGYGPNKLQGWYPGNILAGPQGTLFGATGFGGAGGTSHPCSPYGDACGTFYQFDPSATLSPYNVLYSFAGADNGQGGPITLGSDGNYYGVDVNDYLGAVNYANTIYTLTPTGGYRLLVDMASLPIADGRVSSQLVEGDDGYFYGTTLATDAGDPSPPAGEGCGTIFRMDAGGAVTLVASLPSDESLGCQPAGPLVEGPDGAFYGMTNGGGGSPNIFRVTKSGLFTVLHTLSPKEGILPASYGLILGGDGVLYGTSTLGGTPTAGCPNGCGTIYSITTSGTFTLLYTFMGGQTGAFPGSLFQLGEQGNNLPSAMKVSDTSGRIFGVAGGDGQTGSPAGTVFMVTLPPGHQVAPVQIQMFKQSDMTPVTSSSQIDPNTPLVLQWTAPNAYSNTMRQCFANTVNPKDNNGEADWSGKQTGNPNSEGYSGQTVVTPQYSGDYTFSLTCGGVESAFFSMTVKETLEITTAAMPDANVGQNYSVTPALSGGNSPYTWSVTSGALPPGLSLDGPSGTISGTPKQFGNFSFTLQVKDSSPTPETATVNLTLAVKTGLVVSPALLTSAKINAPYSQKITVTGGVQPYTIVVSSGTLPDGLTLNSMSGVLSGTPTKPGNYNFTLTVTDAENPQATTNQTYVLKVASELLTVDATALPPGAVGENYPNLGRVITGGIGPYNGTVISGAMPKGVGFDVTGNTLSIGGQPMQYGSGSPFTVQITDSDTPPQVATATYTIPVKSTLKITTPLTLDPATYGEPYFFMVSATGGVLPYHWTTGFNLNTLGLTFSTIDGYFGGTPTVTGSYIGPLSVTDSEDIPASDQEQITINIASPQGAALTSTALTASTTAAGVGQSVTFTAKVNVVAGTPLGIITFASGSNVLGTASLVNGVATFTTSFSAAGVYNVVASYPGDDADQASASTAVPITVVAPTVSASVTPGSITIQPGSSGTMTISITPSGGYTGTVGFSCGSLPAHISCTFAPPSLTIAPGAGLVTDVLTIHTAAPAVALAVPPNPDRRRPAPQATLAMVFGLPGLFGMMAFSRKGRGRRIRRLICLAVIAGSGMVGLGSLTGCGAGASGTSARAGAYTIPVTLTLSGGATQTVNAAVVVR